MSGLERVLVTGASRGIGRAIAERLIAGGRRVVLVARDAARLRAVAAGASDRAVAVEADLAADPDILERALVPFGGLDALIHAAGVAPHAPLESIEEHQLELAHALHVRAPLRMSQALARHLRAERRPGAIVHVASTLGLRPAAGTLVYSATKAALLSLTRTLALELASDGIRVNAVAPGVVDTEMVRTLRAPYTEAGGSDAARVAAQLESLRALHPLGRLGSPADVAAAVLYLLDAEWVTGSVLTVDGGLTAG